MRLVDSFRACCKHKSMRVYSTAPEEREEYEHAALAWYIKYSSLSLSYESHLFFYELVNLLKKFLLLKVAVVVETPTSQVVMILVVLILSLAYHVQYRPYVESIVNQLEVASSVFQIGLVIALVAIFMPEGVDQDMKEGFAILLLVVLSCVLVAFGVGAVVASRARRNRLPRIVRAVMLLYVKYTFWKVSDGTIEAVAEAMRRRSVKQRAKKNAVEDDADDVALMEVKGFLEASEPNLSLVANEGSTIAVNTSLSLCKEMQDSELPTVQLRKTFNGKIKLRDVIPEASKYPPDTISAIRVFPCQHLRDLVIVHRHNPCSSGASERADRIFCAFLAEHPNPFEGLPGASDTLWLNICMQMAAMHAMGTPPELRKSLSWVALLCVFWTGVVFFTLFDEVDATSAGVSVSGGMVIAGLALAYGRHSFQGLAKLLSKQLNINVRDMLALQLLPAEDTGGTQKDQPKMDAQVDVSWCEHYLSKSSAWLTESALVPRGQKSKSMTMDPKAIRTTVEAFAEARNLVARSLLIRLHLRDTSVNAFLATSYCNKLILRDNVAMPYDGAMVHASSWQRSAIRATNATFITGGAASCKCELPCAECGASIVFLLGAENAEENEQQNGYFVQCTACQAVSFVASCPVNLWRALLKTRKLQLATLQRATARAALANVEDKKSDAANEMSQHSNHHEESKDDIMIPGVIVHDNKSASSSSGDDGDCDKPSLRQENERKNSIEEESKKMEASLSSDESEDSIAGEMEKTLHLEDTSFPIQEAHEYDIQETQISESNEHIRKLASKKNKKKKKKKKQKLSQVDVRRSTVGDLLNTMTSIKTDVFDWSKSSSSGDNSSDSNGNSD